MSMNVINVIRVTGDEEEIKRMMSAVTVLTDEGIPCFDFNKVIPMPDELRVPNDGKPLIRSHLNNYLTMVNPASQTSDAAFEKLSEKEFAELHKVIFNYYNKSNTYLLNCFLPAPDAQEAQLGEKLAHNIVKYGEPTWYEWSIKNWCTKWNAYYPSQVDDHTLAFCTAWASPLPVVYKLAEMFPSLEIEHSSANGDFGYNVDRRTYKNGKLYKRQSPESCSEEAFALAAEIIGYDPREEEPAEENEEQPEM